MMSLASLLEPPDKNPGCDHAVLLVENKVYPAVCMRSMMELFLMSPMCGSRPRESQKPTATVCRMGRGACRRWNMFTVLVYASAHAAGSV
jgi:hypothetical protein